MVWHENGKYGVHHGRTIRAPSQQWNSGTDIRCKGTGEGYITKVVTKLDSMLDEEELRRLIDSFSLADGFDKTAVVKASSHRKFERFSWQKGYESDEVLFSMKKRKRWLIPELLREHFEENSESCSDSGEEPRVVLIERQGTNEVGKHTRVRKGDCARVTNNQGLNTAVEGKERKLAHVGDLYKASQEAEVVYEFSSTVANNVWPNHRESKLGEDYVWLDSSKHAKSKCKIKGVRNKKRLWGTYRPAEFNQPDNLSLRNCHHDNSAYDEDVEDLQADTGSRTCFEIGSYIADAIDGTEKKGAVHTMDYRNYSAHNKHTCVAVSETVKHGKGSAVFIELDDNQEFIQVSSENNTPSNTEGDKIYAKENTTLVQKFDLEVLEESILPDSLRETFGDRYKEGKSCPRKFSIALVNDSHLVFEAQKGHCGITDCVSMTTTVISSCHANFVVAFKELEKQTNLTVLDIEQKFNIHSDTSQKNGSGNKDSSKKVGKTVIEYAQLNDICGYTTRAVSISTAFAEIGSQADNAKRYHTLPESQVTNAGTHQDCCGICYEELHHSTEEFTSLNDCHHWFCNICWHAYLTEQTQHGKTTIQCPAHNCSINVDATTFMALAPAVFLKHTNIKMQKAVEMSPEWKWCPKETCGLVSTLNCEFKNKEHCTSHTSKGTKISNLPTTCSCCKTWCFECQEEPHWPATCQMAQKFRRQTKTYQEILNAKGECIKSVFVKHCPACHYPIEKGGGCPHMDCIMCGGQFCWECLQEWDQHRYRPSCEGGKVEEEVELTGEIGSLRYNRNVRIAVAQFQARKIQVMFKMYHSVESITSAVLFHEGNPQVSKRPNNTRGASSSQKLLQQLSDYSVSETLKKIVDFKFLSHSVIEGCAIFMAMSRSSKGHRQLQRNIDNLQFIISRLEEYAENVTEKLCFDTALQAVELLLHSGAQSLMNINRAAH